MAKSTPKKAAAKPRTPNRLKEVREKGLVLSQGQVGKLLEPPLDATSVSKHEGGTRPISTHYAKQYAALFGVETHELFLVLPSAEVEADA
jgi:DNA-binding XRE family transcriptional regulator